MKTPNGYFVVDAELMLSLLQDRGISTQDLLAVGLHRRTIRKMKRGEPVQHQSLVRLYEALNLNWDDDQARALRHGKPKATSNGKVLCLPSWEETGTPSEWKTTSHGLQYKLQQLRHVEIEGLLARGKCYDLRQFDDAARERVRRALGQHSRVLKRLHRMPAFPQFLACGYCDADHFWAIDHHEEGMTLAEFLQQDKLQGKGLSVDATLDLMAQLLDALIVLHSRKIIRRELTPESILIQPNGNLMLTDFELCKLLDEQPTVVPGRLPVSRWVAPEVGQGTVDASADVYSWGKIFLYVATGQQPPEFVRPQHTEIPGYPKGLRQLLQNATSAGFRSRPSAAIARGQLLRVMEA